MADGACAKIVVFIPGRLKNHLKPGVGQNGCAPKRRARSSSKLILFSLTLKLPPPPPAPTSKSTRFCKGSRPISKKAGCAPKGCAQKRHAPNNTYIKSVHPQRCAPKGCLVKWGVRPTVVFMFGRSKANDSTPRVGQQRVCVKSVCTARLNMSKKILLVKWPRCPQSARQCFVKDSDVFRNARFVPKGRVPKRRAPNTRPSRVFDDQAFSTLSQC